MEEHAQTKKWKFVTEFLALSITYPGLTHKLQISHTTWEMCWRKEMISYGMRYIPEILRQSLILCSNDKLLRYYRPDLDLYLKTDNSGVAIGMALLQSDTNDTNEKDSLYPIAYGSKTLTSAATCYANIERELLGMVGALEKFHYFRYGRPVIILTDHKPLTSILKKALVNAPPRLQRLLLLRLNNYNATLNWILGKDMIFPIM